MKAIFLLFLSALFASPPLRAQLVNGREMKPEAGDQTKLTSSLGALMGKKTKREIGIIRMTKRITVLS